MEYNPNCEKKIRKYSGRIMFPTTHDLHIEHANWWMPFLTGLLEKGNDVLIVTKPELASVSRICMGLYKYRDQMEFRFTIGTVEDGVRKFWEPNAPSIRERLSALQYVRYRAFKLRTSISIEPMLDYDPGELIKKVDPYVTGEIWIGTMNHMSRNDFKDDEQVWYDRMQEINSYQNIENVYQKFKDHPKVKWKDSIQKMLGLPE